ncbi:MAG: SDR family oxidoreductase [Planifilum fimeticola]
MRTGEQPTALITGSARGLGRMAATLLAEVGWAVALNFRRNEKAARELCGRLRDAGRTAEIFQGDLTRTGEVDTLVRRVMERFGRVDALVHAVGPFIRERRRFAEYTPEEIDELIDGNFRSALHAVRAVLPHMRRQGGGRILLFGFGRAGEAPAWPDRAVYAAAKTGLVSFVKSLAVEEAPFGITVNMVCPGDIVGENKEKRIDEVSGQRDEETPRGRPGSGEDVARVIRFLCEPDSDFVTGNIINVTGGLDVIHPVSKAGR